MEEWEDGFGGADGPAPSRFRVRTSIAVNDLEGCSPLQPPEPSGRGDGPSDC
jgi:hypothetical protein